MVGKISYLIAKPSSGEYSAFAKCLTEKGTKMYGTDVYSYCQEQKKLFGKSLKGLPPIKMHCSVMAIHALKKATEDFEGK